MLLARPFGLLTAFLLVINVTTQIGTSLAQSPSSSHSSTTAHLSLSHVKNSTTVSSSHTTKTKSTKSKSTKTKSTRTKSTTDTESAPGSSQSQTSNTDTLVEGSGSVTSQTVTSSSTAGEPGLPTSDPGPNSLSSTSDSGTNSSSTATTTNQSGSVLLPPDASSAPTPTSSSGSGSVTGSATVTTTTSQGVFTLPASSVSSAQSKATAVAGGVATFQKNPTKENAQDTKDKVDDALGAALALAVGGGILGGLFGSLASFLGVTQAAAVAALSAADLAAAAAAVAATLPAVEKALEDIKKEKEKDDQQSKSASKSKSTKSSSTSCSARTVTDFYVSCITGHSTQTCSTYTRSVVSGCSVTATTITTATAVTASFVTETEIDNVGSAKDSYHHYSLVPGKPPLFVVAGKYTLTLSNSAIGTNSTSDTTAKSTSLSQASSTSHSTGASTSTATSQPSSSSGASGASSLTTKSDSSKFSTHATSTTSPSLSKTTHASSKTTQSTPSGAYTYTSIKNIGVPVPSNAPSCDNGSRKWSFRQDVTVSPNEMVNSVNMYWNVNDASGKDGNWVASVSYAYPSSPGSITTWVGGSASNPSPQTGKQESSINFSGGQNKVAVLLRLFLSVSKTTQFTVAITGTFACTPPVPENPSGTQLVINSGCVTVNGSPRCAADAGKISSAYESSYHVNADQGETSTATILAKFDSNERFAAQASPGCQLNAHWPRTYGQVFFGQDGCLYDSSGQSIDGQCCSSPDSGHSGPVTNPYRDPRPAASCERTPWGLGVNFSIWIKGWVNDGGAALWKEVAGCGALTDKKFGSNHDTKNDGSTEAIGSYQAEYFMEFNLPITFKTGCVGRAMGSAGAPKAHYC